MPQVNVVPQSGSSRLSWEKATAIAIIGKNGEEEHRRRVQPDRDDDEPERRGDAVRRCCRRQSDTTLASRPIADPRSPLSTGS